MSFTEPLLSEGSAGLQWFMKAFRQDSLRPNRLLRETEKPRLRASAQYHPAANVSQLGKSGNTFMGVLGVARSNHIFPTCAICQLLEQVDAGRTLGHD